MTRKELLDGYSLGRYFRPKKKKKQLGKKIGEELYSGNGREKPSGKPSGLDGGWLSKE